MDLATNEDVGVPAAVPSTSKHGSSSNPTTSERKISLENAHEMRITRGGQIRSFVRYALKSFEDNPDKPLTLHTLSPPQTQQKSIPTKKRKRSSDDDGHKEQDDTETRSDSELVQLNESDSNDHQKSNQESKVKSRFKSSNDIVASTIPRLISVVEIIKREYLKSRPKARVRVGLWQYNEIGWLEAGDGSGGADASGGQDTTKEEDRAKMIIEALEGGKKHLPIRRTPYLKVTLCVYELDDASLSSRPRMTLQQPATLKMSKSARSREVRKARAANALAAASANSVDAEKVSVGEGSTKKRKLEETEGPGLDAEMAECGS